LQKLQYTPGILSPGVFFFIYNYSGVI